MDLFDRYSEISHPKNLQQDVPPRVFDKLLIVFLLRNTIILDLYPNNTRKINFYLAEQLSLLESMN